MCDTANARSAFCVHTKYDICAGIRSLTSRRGRLSHVSRDLRGNAAAVKKTLSA